MKLLPLALLAPFALGACGAHPFGTKHGPSTLSPSNSPSSPNAAAEDCTVAGIQQISIPTAADVPGSPAFTYNFEYVAPTGDNPTVVFIPGGPGQTSISTDSDMKPNFPDGFGYLLTDPRGVGCNAPAAGTAYPASFYRSRYVADDINAAIKATGLTNYIIYGISYGTLVATITASKAETTGAVAPKAVVLEGTLGRAMNDGEADMTYVSLWQAKMNASTALTQAFQASPLPLNQSADKWVGVIHMSLEYGTITDDGQEIDLLDRLTSLAISSDTSDQQKASSIFDSMYQDMTTGISAAGADDFYAYVACQEIWTRLNGEVMTNGLLVPTSGNECASAGLSFNADKFDAANWLIKAPIYYLDGANDPATPIVLAHYHFDAQTKSPNRQMAIVTSAGHNPLEISLGDCIHTVWTAISADTPLSAALGTCKWTPGINLVTADKTSGAEVSTAVSQ